MDLPEDAVGRVAVYTIDGSPPEGMAAVPPRSDPFARLGIALDSHLAAPVLAAALVVVLVLGLLLLRR